MQQLLIERYMELAEKLLKLFRQLLFSLEQDQSRSSTYKQKTGGRYPGLVKTRYLRK